MKNFKSFINEAGPNAKPKAKGEADFVDAHKVEISDPEEQGTDGSAKVTTKEGSGKRKVDRLDNKQAMGEEVEELDEDKKLEAIAKKQLAHIPGKLYKAAGGGYYKNHKGKSYISNPAVGSKPSASRSYSSSNDDDDAVAFQKRDSAGIKLSYDDFVGSGYGGGGGALTYNHKKNRVREEVELDELSKSTLASYAKKATRDARMKMAAGKDFERHAITSRKPEYKAGAKKWEDKYKSDARRREAGANKAIDRLAKEEVELDEEQLIEMDKSGVPFTPDKPKKNPPAKAGKYGQGPSTAKHLAQMALKKQLEKMKEEVEEAAYTNPGLEALAKKKKSLRQMKQGMAEADFSKKETKMAHTIGKEFEKKGVGDESKGGPYAVASAMVRDKPEGAQKAYKTIQSKMKQETDAELLFNLYNDLNEENQEMFMSQLEEDAESLLQFAKNFLAD